MNRQTVFLVFTGLLFTASLAGLRQTFADPVAEPKVASLNNLVQQRRDCLADALKSYLAGFRSGRAPVHPLLYVNDQLLEAELELDQDEASRKKAYVTYLRTATDVERLAQAGLNAGTGTRQEVLVAKAQRLRAEIAIVGLGK